MIDYIQQNWENIAAVIAYTVTAASIVVKLTPTPEDDKILAKVWKALNLIAINPKNK